MPTRSLQIARDAQNVHVWYGKRDPATGAYYTVGSGNDITAATITILAKDGTTILAATAMTALTALKGFVYDWAPGSALDSRPIVYVLIQPTTAKPRALVPDEITILDVADVLKRQDEIETALKGPGFDAATDTLEEIRDRVDELVDAHDGKVVTVEVNG